MLNLIQTEFLKLRRRKFVWFMLSTSLIMPFLALLYFNYFGKKDIEPMQFYKMSAYGFTLFIILPIVLGMLCTMLMREENQYDMLKQLWIVPVSKMGYLLSKFFVVFVYSICFMLITAVASVIFSVIPGYVALEWGSILNLLEKCIIIGVLSAFVMLPILAIAASQKGYILPACVTLVYAFSGFILMSINAYLHPISSMALIVICNNDIPGVVLKQEMNIPFAFLCIGIWDIVALLLSNIALKRRK
nr:ABC transporter permease [Anaerosporobacter faecicola]